MKISPDSQTGKVRFLAAPHSVGAGALKRLGLWTELPVVLDGEDVADVAGMAVSAHAPFSLYGERLNIAATDATRRRHALDTIKTYIEQAARYPAVVKVICHAAPRTWYSNDGGLQQQGDYDLLIEGMRELADAAASHDLAVAVENNRVYFRDMFPDCPPGEGGLSANTYFGTVPEEWRRIAVDVARESLGLCLDTSHACTYAQLSPPEERPATLMKYLAHPSLISHVHWSDNLLYDEGGRLDSHLPIGEGTLPLELHRAVLGLGATILVEHFYDMERLERELDFISRLAGRSCAEERPCKGSES